MNGIVDPKLIKRVDDLKAELKNATAELNEALSKTALFTRVLEFSTDQKISEKSAKTHALKVTHDFFKTQQ
jgi:hypothetical protein